jgi:hypothetical protein
MPSAAARTREPPFGIVWGFEFSLRPFARDRPANPAAAR